MSLITCELPARQAGWTPSESIAEYFIKIYRKYVPHLYIDVFEDCEVWIVRVFNPIQKKEHAYIHCLETDGRRCRTVKKYELIVNERSKNSISSENVHQLSGIMRKRLICSEIIKICGFPSAEFLLGDNEDLYYSAGVYMFHFHFDIDGVLVRFEQEKQ